MLKPYRTTNLPGGVRVAKPGLQACVLSCSAWKAIADGGYPLESLPRQTCGVGRQEVTVREHDRDALLPGLVEVCRDSTPRSWLLGWLVWTTCRLRGSRRPTPR
jgi:hypothetical protein